jgi:hypothetical protein
MPDEPESRRRVGARKIKSSDALVFREHEIDAATSGFYVQVIGFALRRRPHCSFPVSRRHSRRATRAQPMESALLLEK